MDASSIRCVITAGPTREHLDPVRFFTNRSSGRMGFALAEAACRRGWEVDLVSGPVALAPPEEARLHRVVSAEEMFRRTRELFPGCDILILCAAVADFRPARPSERKMKKEKQPFSLAMEPTVDIARTLGAAKEKQLVVGFAAETDDLERSAQEKLARKNLDWIVANRVGGPGCAMEGEENTILMISSSGEKHRFGPAPKRAVAEFILDSIPLKTHHG